MRFVGPWGLAFISVTAVITFFFAVQLSGGRQFYHSDTHGLLYPLHELIAEELQAGRLPLWDPYSLCGYPIAASYVAAVFLPQKLLYLVLPFDLAFQVTIVLKHLLGGLCFLPLGRRLGWSPAASVVAALVFALSGPFISISDFHAFSPECFPLVLWLAVRCIQRRSLGTPATIRAWVALVLAVGFAFLHGDLQAFYAASAMLIAIPAALGSDLAPWGRRGAAKAVLAMAGAILSGLLLGAVQLLPSADLLAHSSRASLSVEERLAHSVDPSFASLAKLLIPSPVSAAASTDFIAFPYLGAGAALLAVLGAFGALGPVRATAAQGNRGGGNNRAAWVFFGAIGLLALLLSFGGAVPVLEPLSQVVPGLSLFRYPQKWLMPLSFAFAALVGAAVLALERVGRRRMAYSLGILAVVDLLASSSLFLQERVVGAAAYEPSRLLELRAVCPAFDPRDRVLRLPTDGTFASGPLEALAASTDPQDARARYRFRTAMIAWNVQTLLGGNGSRAGARSVSGLTSFSFRSAEALQRAAAEAGRIDRYLDVVGARWVLTTPADRARMSAGGGVRGVLEKGREPEAAWSTELGDLELHRRSGALPRARWVGTWRVAANEPAAIRAVLDPRLRLESAAIVQDPEGSLGAPPDRGEEIGAARVAMLKDGTTTLVIEVESPSAGLLVVSDSFDGGWKARVNGKEAPVLRADVVGRAVSVPAGRAHVEMVYAPAALMTGWVLSLLSAGTLGVAWILAAIAGRRATRGTARPVIQAAPHDRKVETAGALLQS
ncbi:MAG TPA: hypothetical protein VMT52_04355 [Planctomycetota bacterium]|nr:hypothetical protein [Planctomycetota bacterium]